MDRVLVEQAMAGDRGAFNELARLSIARLYAVAQMILRDPDRASDATQEALVAAWRDLSALRDADRFEAWVAPRTGPSVPSRGAPGSAAADGGDPRSDARRPRWG
jgi:hypothetical protein